MSAPRRIKLNINGVLLLDKPYGFSSNGALQKARWLYSAAKAGHTGVLDPLATGLLPVCFGEATKFSSYLLDADKGYRATVQFGAVTTTGDVEGEVVLQRPVAFDLAALEAAIAAHTGPISQVPPMYSALKHQGKALYEYAREGVEIPREPRQVSIRRFECLSRDGDSLVVRVECSKGTYVRTLASDLGAFLGCGAHLTALRRTRIGPFDLNGSVTLADFEALPAEARESWLAPVDALLAHLPLVALDESQARSFTHGQSAAGIDGVVGAMFRAYDGTRFLGIGTLAEGGMLVPTRLMATGNQ